MIATIPWPELMHSVQRIVHAGSEGLWVASEPMRGLEYVQVRCYATSNFGFATLVSCRTDLPKILASPGRLQISSPSEEMVLLSFCPLVAALVDRQKLSNVFPQETGDRNPHAIGVDWEPVLIFGSVQSVELLVPSHAIDVMATTQSVKKLTPDWKGVGLN